jgi:nucleoside-diphosphate-sugar epimerase
MARVLITGGAGFLGMNMAAAMAEQGWDVRLLDVVEPAETLGPRQEWRRGDVRDARTMRDAVAGCDVVVDNAALVPVSGAELAEFRSVNVGGCRTTLDAARSAGAYALHVSSSSIFGLPTRLPVTEETPMAPFEDYGRSKAEAETLVRALRGDGMRVSSLRARALLGRGRLGLFELVFSRIHANQRVPMFGRGTNLLQMCDARDFASAVLAAVEHESNGEYNVGAAVFGRVRDDLRALIDRVGSTAKLLPVPAAAIRATLRLLSAVGASPFTPWHWHASGSAFFASLDRIEAELGWRPRYSNVDALEHAYAEYLAGHAGGSAHSRPLRGALAQLLRGRDQ